MSKDLNFVYKRLFLEKYAPRRVCVFVSGTKHIGTSWCALNLAHALNALKKRVLLIDANGNLSNISSYILLTNPLYLEDYISGKKTLNQLVTAYKNKDFNILTAAPGNNFFADYPLGKAYVFADDINILAQDYDYTLIDAGTDITEKTISLFQLAQNINIMCSENSSDLIKILDILHFLHRTEINTHCNLIINRVNSSEDGQKIYKELCKATERSGLIAPDLLGVVRFDTRVRDTIRNKELLLSRYPESEAAIDLTNIARKIDLEEYYEK